jgi:hypothetical protein
VYLLHKYLLAQHTASNQTPLDPTVTPSRSCTWFNPNLHRRTHILTRSSMLSFGTTYLHHDNVAKERPSPTFRSRRYTKARGIQIPWAENRHRRAPIPLTDHHRLQDSANRSLSLSRPSSANLMVRSSHRYITTRSLSTPHAIP